MTSFIIKRIGPTTHCFRLERDLECWIGFWRHIGDGSGSSSILARRQHWVWADSTPVSSTEPRWEHTEPDIGDRCGILRGAGSWHGNNCEHLKPFICEKGKYFGWNASKSVFQQLAASLAPTGFDNIMYSQFVFWTSSQVIIIVGLIIIIILTLIIILWKVTVTVAVVYWCPLQVVTNEHFTHYGGFYHFSFNIYDVFFGSLHTSHPNNIWPDINCGNKTTSNRHHKITFVNNTNSKSNPT